MLQVPKILEHLSSLFSALPQVEAIALGGSRTGEASDELSDFDVCVYTNAAIPVSVRQEIVGTLGGASVADIGMDYFGEGDEWRDAETGAQFDVMYFSLEWMREQVERVLVQHRPSLGYTTAFAHTISRSQILYDPKGALAALQALSHEPYPEALLGAIVRHNYPLLRGTISSYSAQLEKAVKRDDLVSLNHRLAALLASYFDIVFAVNRLYHPGEKRLLQLSLATCATLPDGFAEDLPLVLNAEGEGLLEVVGRSLDALDHWLLREGFADALQGGLGKTP